MALVAGGVRLYALTRDPLWYDEVMHLQISRDLTWHTLSCKDALIEPFFCTFLFLWLKLSTSELWIRLYAVLFGLFTVAVAYLFGRRLAGRRGGFACGLLAALSPMLVFYSRDVKMYPLVTFLELSVAYLALVYASPEGKPRHLGAYMVLAVLLLHTHLVAPFYLAGLNVVYLVFRARSLKKTVGWLAAQAAVVVATVPYLYAQYRFAQVFEGAFFFAPRPRPRSLLITASNLLVGYATQEWVRLAAVGVFAGLVVLAFVLLKGKRAEAAVLVGAAALHVAGLYVFSLRAAHSFYVDRYLIGSAAPILVVAGAGLARLRWSWVRRPLGAVVLILFGFGLRDYYAYRFTPDFREHPGVLRTFDAHGLRDVIRAEAQPRDAVWHVTFFELAQLRWYVPEMPHVLIDMGRRADSTLSLLLPDRGRDFYGNHPVELETVLEDAGRVWVVIPENSPGLYARRHGFLAWLDAHAPRLRHVYFGGRYAPASLYLFDLSAKAPEGNHCFEEVFIPPESPEEVREKRKVFRLAAEELEPGPGLRFEVENATDEARSARYQVTYSTFTCIAPRFDRCLGSESQWIVQPYRDRYSARQAFHTRVNARSNPKDALVHLVDVKPGSYDVFIERTREGPRYAIPTAGMTLAVGAYTFEIPAKAEASAGGWEWVHAGTIDKTGEGVIEVKVFAHRPARRPEEMATFSRVAFVPHSAGVTGDPVVSRGTLEIPAHGSKTVEAHPPHAEGRMDFVLAAPNSSGSVWLYLGPAL